MTLTDIKAECEKHEARADSMHAKVDKFTKEEAEGSSDAIAPSKTALTHPAKRIATAVVAVVVTFTAAMWYLGVIPNGSDEDPGESNLAPSVDSFVIMNTANGMMIWVNASDSDSAISSIKVSAYLDATPLGSPMFEKLYWVNKSTANITDVLFLGNLPSGNYVIQTSAIDMLGKESAPSGYQHFTLAD